MNNNPSNRPPVTPLKTKNDAVGIETPSGGFIYNPFHKDIMSKLGHATFSPGLFAIGKSPDSCTSNSFTPSRSRTFYSPDEASYITPVEIDENPILQMKLQERLANHYNDDGLQKRIDSYFQSNLIVPSPEPSRLPPVMFEQSGFRTSSMLPNCVSSVTPKRFKKNLTQTAPKDSPTVMVSDVGIQTNVSIPNNVNFEEIMRAYNKSLNEKENFRKVNPKAQSSMLVDRLPPSNTCTGNNTETSFSLNSFSELLDSSSSAVSLDACSVSRAIDLYPHSSIFVCLACRSSHAFNSYGKRNLFVGHLDAIQDISGCEDSSPQPAPPIFGPLTSCNHMAQQRRHQQDDMALTPPSPPNADETSSTDDEDARDGKEFNAQKISQDFMLPISWTSCLKSGPSFSYNEEDEELSPIKRSQDFTSSLRNNACTVHEEQTEPVEVPVEVVSQSQTFWHSPDDRSRIVRPIEEAFGCADMSPILNTDTDEDNVQLSFMDQG